MKKLTVFIVALLALLVLAGTAAPTALAQGITGDKVVRGGNFVLQDGESLDGNLVVLGGTAHIENGGVVHGDLSMAGSVVTVDGQVTGNVSLFGGSLELNETAQVDGNLANLAGSVRRAPGAVVHGDTFNGLNTPGRSNPAPVTPGFSVQRETPRSWLARFINWQLGTIGSILLMGLLGLVLVLVAPRAVGRAASAVAVQPGLSLIFGFLTLILGILAGAILLIPCGLGLLVWLALTAGAVLGWISAGLWLGQRLLNGLKMRSASSIAEVLAGVVLITFLSRLPCVGWLFGLVFVSLGLGAVVLTRFGTRDAEGPRTGPQLMAPVPAGPAPTGGSGGDFRPMPEPTELELAARPVVSTLRPAEVEGGMVSSPDVSVVASPRTALTDVAGIDASLAERLQAAGIRTLADLAASHPVELATATGVPVGQIMTENWIGQAQRLA